MLLRRTPSSGALPGPILGVKGFYDCPCNPLPRQHLRTVGASNWVVVQHHVAGEVRVRHDHRCALGKSRVACPRLVVYFPRVATAAATSPRRLCRLTASLLVVSSCLLFVWYDRVSDRVCVENRRGHRGRCLQSRPAKLGTRCASASAVAGIDWELATASIVALKLMIHMFSPMPPHDRWHC